MLALKLLEIIKKKDEVIECQNKLIEKLVADNLEKENFINEMHKM